MSDFSALSLVDAAEGLKKKDFSAVELAEFTVREAAEIMIRTENAFDTARVLTKVPERDVEL